MPYNQSVGAQGESAAADFLRGKGAQILQMNYRTPYGEIDIIAILEGVLVFCEVKRRSGKLNGAPSEAVTPAKQAHILRTAMLYLQENRLEDAPVRFDIVEILPDGVKHIENAFDATDMF